MDFWRSKIDNSCGYRMLNAYVQLLMFANSLMRHSSLLTLEKLLLELQQSPARPGHCTL
jgi:hypothetical protein